MSAAIQGYRKLPPETKACLSKVNVALNLGLGIALGLCKYILGMYPEFPELLSEQQDKELTSIVKETEADIEPWRSRAYE